MRTSVTCAIPAHTPATTPLAALSVPARWVTHWHQMAEAAEDSGTAQSVSLCAAVSPNLRRWWKARCWFLC
ncbi:hypothetical protein XELAEV_18003342mg [Xenopus laevis]|nr:hypothetical protein XELAEV_18003342mg [Xenopus laevis]